MCEVGCERLVGADMRFHLGLVWVVLEIQKTVAEGNSEVLLCSRGDGIQHSGIKQNGEEYGQKNVSGYN